MLPLLLKKILPGALAVIALLFVAWAIHHHGYKAGSQEIQAAWNEDKLLQQEAHQKLVDEYAKREQAHQAENERISHELAEARKAHDAALADQRAAHQQRLLLSEGRAAVYRRQAEAGTAECRDLAGHAARLDRALEQGRGLVQELRGTLGLRDQQLRHLGEQILNDRKVLGDSDE